jgi:hypothetical protein
MMGYAVTLMMLTFCICLGMYATTGQAGILISLFTGGIDTTQVSAIIAIFAAAVVAGAVAGGIIGSNFGIMYAIPAGAAYTLLNLFIMPMGGIANAGLPSMVSWILFFVINVLMLAAIVDFVRGVGGM